MTFAYKNIKTSDMIFFQTFTLLYSDCVVCLYEKDIDGITISSSKFRKISVEVYGCRYIHVLFEVSSKKTQLRPGVFSYSTLQLPKRRAPALSSSDGSLDKTLFLMISCERGSRLNEPEAVHSALIG